MDGKCISQCPPEYESKNLYGDKNICSLITSNSNCSNVNCHNDGTCTQELGSPICKCKEGFYGERCDYDQSSLEIMKESLNTNIDTINTINPLIPISDQSLIAINNISSLTKNIPELVTDQLNEIITNIVNQQLQSMISGLLTFQSYAFSIADFSLEIKNKL